MIQNRIIGSGIAKLDEILFNPRNWRIHPLNQQDALKSVLDNVGWVQEVIVNQRTGNLVDGHLRCQLAARNGETEIPVKYVDLSEDEEALILATIDPIAGMAATDKTKLDELMNAIQSEDEAVRKTMNEIAEKERLEYGKQDIEDVEPQIDKAEELRVKWGVESGQIWKLGEHRIICGDCTDKAVVDRVMGGEKAKIEIHDPPYGMRLDTDWSGAKSRLDFAQEKKLFGGKKYDSVIGDEIDFNPSHLFDRELPEEMFLWGADYYLDRIPAALTGSLLVWDKRLDESADKMYGSCFEICWSAKRHKRDILRFRWSGVFGTEQEPEHKRFHPTQKPVGLYELILNKYSEDGDISGDWYLGVGSHLLACERLSRKCRAIEISTGYVAVSIQRWVDATGGVPELIG